MTGALVGREGADTLPYKECGPVGAGRRARPSVSDTLPYRIFVAPQAQARPGEVLWRRRHSSTQAG